MPLLVLGVIWCLRLGAAPALGHLALGDMSICEIVASVAGLETSPCPPKASLPPSLNLRPCCHGWDACAGELWFLVGDAESQAQAALLVGGASGQSC